MITDKMWEWKKYNTIKEWIIDYREKVQKNLQELKDLSWWWFEYHLWNDVFLGSNWDDGWRDQYRFVVYVDKDTKKITWKQVYKAINIVNPVPYSKLTRKGWRHI